MGRNRLYGQTVVAIHGSSRYGNKLAHAYEGGFLRGRGHSLAKPQL